MSRFYGIVSGAAQTQATRRGHRELETTAASWKGAIRVYLWLADDGTQHYRVSMIPWHGQGDRREIAEGQFNA